MRYQAVNLAEKLAQFSEHWTPKVIAALNDYRVKLAKIQGDFVWHEHRDTDELFLVLDGHMVIEMRDGVIELAAGDLYVVPKGVEHRPSAREECHVLLVEPAGVVNTGDIDSTLTAPVDEWL